MTTPHDENNTNSSDNNHPRNGTMDQPENILNESSIALYAIGALNEEESRALEGRLFAGEIDSADMHTHGETIVALCEDIAAVMPAPRRALKNSILETVAKLEGQKDASERQSDPDRDLAHVIHRVDEGEWVDALPGIRMKILFQNPTTGRTTYLARIQPGATYPDHRHHSEEELLVIEGDIFLGGHTLYPGDYSLSVPDSQHHDTHSRNGCLCVVTSMMNDELL